MILPRVSIIIVNWNGVHLLKECLDSVFKQTFKDFEVILVDNGSIDGSLEYVSITFPDVRLISLPVNRGFTGGNNEGFRQSNGSLIVLLNNDASLKEDWLERMVDVIDSDDRLGSCASKIIIDGTDLLDSAGDIFTTAFTGTKLGELQKAGDFTAPRFVTGPCAAAAIYRRSMIEEIGFFDDDFFLNHEDTDLNLRAWIAGWCCRFVPDAVAYHKVSSSIGNLSDISVYFFSRNSLWVWVKNVPFPLLLIYFPQRILYEINSFINLCLIRGKWRPFFCGKMDAIRGMPSMWQKRRQLSKLKKRSNIQIADSLIPVTKYLFHRFRLVSAMTNNGKQ